MTTLTKVIIGVVLSILLSSCSFISGVNGNGNVTNETITLQSNFNKIDAGHGLNVILTKGNSQNVVVEADENLQEIISIYVEEKTLIIKTDANIGSSERKPAVWSLCSCVNTIASKRGIGLVSICCLKSGPQSITIFFPLISIKTETRKRLSLMFSLKQTGCVFPMIGIP
jgi:hypothetical protein